MEPEYFFSSSYLQELGRNSGCRPTRAHQIVEIDPYDRDLEAARPDIGALQRRERELRNDYHTMRAARDIYIQRCYDLMREKQQKVAEIENLKGQASARETINTTAKARLEQEINEERIFREKAVEAYKANEDKLHAFITELRKRLVTSREDLRRVKDEAVAAAENKTRLEVQLEEGSSAAEQLRADFDKERALLNAQIQRLRDEKETQRNNLDRLEAEAELQNSNLQQLRHKLDEEKSKRKDRDRLEAEVELQKSELQQLRHKLDEEESRRRDRDRLEAEAELQNSELQQLRHKLDEEKSQKSVLLKKMAILDLVRASQEASISACWMHDLYAYMAKVSFLQRDLSRLYVLPEWAALVWDLWAEDAKVHTLVGRAFHYLYRGYYI